jgi:hypothetical protein
MSLKLEQIAVRLEPALREELQARADQDRRPLAGMIRKILHDVVAKPSETAGAPR